MGKKPKGKAALGNVKNVKKTGVVAQQQPKEQGTPRSSKDVKPVVEKVGNKRKFEQVDDTPQNSNNNKNNKNNKNNNKRRKPNKDGGNSAKAVADKETKKPSVDTPKESFARNTTTSNKALTPLQKKFAKKLQGAKFRLLNEKLYTISGSEARELFEKEPVLYQQYHEGFRSQVEKWPVKPVDLMVQFVKSKPTTMVVADFGCGDAALAKALVPRRQTVHSFDLHKDNEFVTVCDISKVPLKDESVDIGIFCLSLMGTNYVDFLREAHRVLKPKGTLKIAEVESRLGDPTTFVSLVRKLGFDVVSKEGMKVFYMFEFVKSPRKPNKTLDIKPEDVLKPCLYKKR